MFDVPKVFGVYGALSKFESLGPIWGGASNKFFLYLGLEFETSKSEILTTAYHNLCWFDVYIFYFTPLILSLFRFT